MNQNELEKEGTEIRESSAPEVLEVAPEVEEVLTPEEKEVKGGARSLEEADRANRAKAFQGEAILEFLADGRVVFSDEELKGYLVQEVGDEKTQEIWQMFESPLFGQLKKDIESVFPELDEKTQAQYLIEVQKGFVETILAGHFKTRELEGLLSGGVRLTAQERANLEKGFPYSAIAATVVREGKPIFILYKSFFDRQKENPELPYNNQSHVTKHEFGHLLNTFGLLVDPELWGEMKVAAARGEIPENLPPALKGMLEALLNPAEAATLEREGGHLYNRFKHLAELPQNKKAWEEETQKYNQARAENLSPDQYIGRLRQIYLEEILAERIANYLESDGREESFLSARFRGVKNISEEDLEKQSQLYEILQGAFAQEKRREWQAKIAEQQFEEEFDLYEDYEDLGLPLELADLNPPVSFKNRQGLVKQKSLFEAIFDFLTGKKEAPSLKKAA